MIRIVARRLLSIPPLLIAISFGVFWLIDLIPGDAAEVLAGNTPTAEQIGKIREQLQLDEPLHVRYGIWLLRAAAGDLGMSFMRDVPVTQLVLEKGPATASLIAISIVLALLVGGTLGIVAGSQRSRVLDRFVDGLSALALSAPPFWLGIISVSLFAVNLRWVPAFGYTDPSSGWASWFGHLILPASAMAAIPAAEIALQLKGSLREIMEEEFILAAEARGLTKRTIVLKHAFRSAAIQLTTILGYRLTWLIGGAAVVEVVFAFPGLGSLVIDSVLTHDVPVLLGIVTVATLAVVVVNLLVDVSYGLLSPKART